MLDIGAPAPDFDRTDQKGRRIVLRELIAQGPVVLYFYPRDFTPVCTKEACVFRDAYEDLRTRQTNIVGVSLDDDDTHRRFSERHELPFSLVSDRDKSLARAYDVLGFLRPLAKRVTYVIDQQSTIRGVFHYELRARKHLTEVERCLATLGS